MEDSVLTEAELEFKKKREEIDLSWQKLATNKHFKVVIKDIQDFCAVDAPSFQQNYLNATNLNQLIAYREGQRSVGMYIKDSQED